MKIPASAILTAPGYPYAGGGAFHVDAVSALPCTGMAMSGIPTSCTGTPAFRIPDYFCASNTGTPATCGCATQTPPGGQRPAADAGVTPNAGSNALSVVSCQAPSPTIVFAPAAPTTITFSQ